MSALYAAPHTNYTFLNSAHSTQRQTTNYKVVKQQQIAQTNFKQRHTTNYKSC